MSKADVIVISAIQKLIKEWSELRSKVVSQVKRDELTEAIIKAEALLKQLKNTKES